MTQAIISRLLKLYFPNFSILHEQTHRGLKKKKKKASNYSVMLKSFLQKLNKKMIIRNSVLPNLIVLKSIMKNIPFVPYLSELLF